MKKNVLIGMILLFLSTTILGCSSTDLKLDKKHADLPPYAINQGVIVENAYIRAAQYPQVLAAVPCYCGCGSVGHVNNLDCFVREMGSKREVLAWDPHGST